MFSRRSRFNRAEDIPPFQVTSRDFQILNYVWKHRFLTSRNIFALAGRSPQQLLRRLHKLFHHGYLDRPRAQIDYYYRGGSQVMIYGLGNRGAKELEERFSIPCRKVDRAAKNREATRLFLRHTLFVAEVMIAIELSCRGSDKVLLVDQEELSSRIPKDVQKADEPFRWKVGFSEKGKAIQLGVIPDKVFARQSVDQPDKIAYYFLEADRATMPASRKNPSQTSFRRKLFAYSETWRQNFTKHVSDLTASARRLEEICFRSRLRLLIESLTFPNHQR